MHVSINRITFFWLCLLLTPQLSFSAFSNYNSILIGDRASGMGGAGVALLGDISSAGFYNPATIAFLEGNSFSAAVGIYKKFDTIFGDKEDFTKAALRINLGFFRSLPASTGSVISWNGYKLGMSIIVPDYDSFKGDIVNKETTVSTLSFTDESLWVGGVIAREIDAQSSWGFTLYYTARNYTRSINDRSFPSANQAIIFYSEKTLAENSLVPIIGYFYKWNPEWSAGLSARLASLKIGSSGSYFQNITDTTGPSVTSINKPDLSGDFKIPSKLSWGLVWNPAKNWTISGSMDFYEGFSYRDLEDANASQFIEFHHTVNGSLGVEYIWTDWMKFRVGGFTNFSSQANPSVQLSHVMDEKVDQLGFSANIAFTTKEKISYTFGGYYTGGRGVSVQRINHEAQIIPKTYQVFTMLVGTSFSL